MPRGRAVFLSFARRERDIALKTAKGASVSRFGMNDWLAVR